VDLAEAVGADLGVMARDSARMRGDGPVVFSAIRNRHKLDDIQQHIEAAWRQATTGSREGAHSHSH